MFIAILLPVDKCSDVQEQACLDIPATSVIGQEQPVQGVAMVQMQQQISEHSSWTVDQLCSLQLEI